MDDATNLGDSDRGAVAGTGTFVTFDLGGQRLAVDVIGVREILDRLDILTLPDASPECLGVVDNRGESVPVMDLAARLGLGASADTGDDRRIIVFDTPDAGGGGPLGIVADRVLDVCKIEGTSIEPPPEHVGGPAGRASVRGLARVENRLVVLLDIATALRGCP